MDDSAAVLSSMVEAMGDFTPAWIDIGTVFHERQAEIFATGSMGRWAPLAGSTMKDKHGMGIAPLMRTHRLFEAVSSAVPRNYGPRFAIYGPPLGTAPDVLQYAHFHAKGTRRMPQRNPVPRLTTQEKGKAVNMMRAHIWGVAYGSAEFHKRWSEDQRSMGLM